MTLVAPKPTYAIGDTVYYPIVETERYQLSCPDCLGEKKWKAISPTGTEYSVGCPRCAASSYSSNAKLPSLWVERAVAKAAARVITGISIDAAGSSWKDGIEYRSSFDNRSYYTMREHEVYPTEEGALAAAEVKAAEKNAEIAEKPQTLVAQHFESLKFDEARWDEFKTGIWHTQYHAANLIERVKQALDGEDGDEERDTATIISDLREAAAWDFKYHIEALPLSPLVKAALASDDAAVRSAVEQLPDAMVNLLSGKCLDGLKAF